MDDSLYMSKRIHNLYPCINAPTLNYDVCHAHSKSKALYFQALFPTEWELKKTVFPPTPKPEFEEHNWELLGPSKKRANSISRKFMNMYPKFQVKFSLCISIQLDLLYIYWFHIRIHFTWSRDLYIFLSVQDSIVLFSKLPHQKSNTLLCIELYLDYIYLFKSLVIILSFSSLHYCKWEI